MNNIVSVSSRDSKKAGVWKSRSLCSKDKRIREKRADTLLEMISDCSDKVVLVLLETLPALACSHGSPSNCWYIQCSRTKIILLTSTPNQRLDQYLVSNNQASNPLRTVEFVT